MSRYYPNLVAETPAEVEQWYDRKIEPLLKSLPVAQVEADTGTVPCRLIPIYPMRETGNQVWWPMPLEIITLDAALAFLKSEGLLYDNSRKTRLGYQRALTIGTF